MRGRRRAVRRTARRTSRRTVRRTRRRMRRRIMVGGMVLLAVGGAAYGAVKLSQQDANKIEQHTGASVEELTEEELIQAMDDLGIQSVDLTDEDKAVITREGNQSPQIDYEEPAPAPSGGLQGEAAGGDPNYIAELEKLADLAQRGVITQEEFEAKKKQLLGL